MAKARSDFMKSTLRAGVATLAVAFTLAQGAAAAENVLEPIKKATQPFDPAPSRPGEEKGGTAPMIIRVAEIVAGARDDRDRVLAIGEAIEIDRSDISGGKRVAPAPPPGAGSRR